MLQLADENGLTCVIRIFMTLPQTKVIKYNELLANTVILQNTIDMGNTIKIMKDEGIEVKNLSPYLTSHIKRFGEYIIDLDEKSEQIVNLDLDKFLK